jgi:arylsulfatase A-like enzyme
MRAIERMPSPRCGRTWGFAALAVGACLLACSDGSPGSDANLLLVTIDTLRADRLGAYGYERDISPNIDDLAADSLLLESFYSPLPLTAPAHSALLTGRDPWETGVRYNGIPLPAGEQTLAEILSVEGFRTAAFVSGWTLKRIVAELDQGFEVYDDSFDEIERRAGETTDRALSWLRENRDSRWFLWIHYFDPHYLYDPPAPHRGRWLREGPPEVKQPSLYDGEIAYVDAQLGRVLETLEELGLAESTFVAVTADHGESLGEHGYLFDHGDLLFEDQVRIPFLLRGPGVPPGRREHRTGRSIDVLPTVLALLGIEPPMGLDGRSLLARDDSDSDLFFESNQCDREGHQKTGCWPLGGEGKLYALRSGRLKLIRHPTRDGTRYQLFDLESDPGELADQGLGPTGEGPALRRRLDAWADGLAPLPVRPEMDREILQNLQALGYLR